MSCFANLQNYSWSHYVNGQPFEILVIAKDDEEARQKVLATFAEIERVEPLYETLELEMRNQTKPREQLAAERNRLFNGIPANFFYSVNTFEYKAGLILDDRDPNSLTLGEFIRKTEPKYCGPACPVSFRSYPGF